MEMLENVLKNVEKCKKYWKCRTLVSIIFKLTIILILSNFAALGGSPYATRLSRSSQNLLTIWKKEKIQLKNSEIL